MNIVNYYNPYTRDNIVFDNGMTHKESAYSDRLYQWNSKLYKELSVKHFQKDNPHWGRENILSIENFLRDYFNKPDLILCKIIYEENKSNGNPLWVFQFKF